MGLRGKRSYSRSGGWFSRMHVRPRPFLHPDLPTAHTRNLCRKTWPAPVRRLRWVSHRARHAEICAAVLTDIRLGLNHGRTTTAIPKVVKPSHRKGVGSVKTKFVRSIVREVAGFAPYERRVLELLRNSKVRVTTEFYYIACFF